MVDYSRLKRLGLVDVAVDVVDVPVVGDRCWISVGDSTFDVKCLIYAYVVDEIGRVFANRLEQNIQDFFVLPLLVGEAVVSLARDYLAVVVGACPEPCTELGTVCPVAILDNVRFLADQRLERGQLCSFRLDYVKAFS